ncbi:MAG: hypothetical protein ACXW6J_12160, partial [Candidatus Binatia bacterium]
GLRKLWGDLQYPKSGSNLAKAQSTPSSERKKIGLLQTVFTILFFDLCELSAFAGDIPSFGCGCAALGSLWLKLRILIDYLRP